MGLKKRIADRSFEIFYKAIRILNETSKNTDEKDSRPRRRSETMQMQSVDLHHNCGFFATRDPHVGTIDTPEQAQASKLRFVRFRLRRPIRISRVVETHEIGMDAPVAHCASRPSTLGLQPQRLCHAFRRTTCASIPASVRGRSHLLCAPRESNVALSEAVLLQYSVLGKTWRACPASDDWRRSGRGGVDLGHVSSLEMTVFVAPHAVECDSR